MSAGDEISRGCVARFPHQPFAGSMARAVVRRLVGFRDHDAESQFLIAVTESVMALAESTDITLTVRLDGDPVVEVEGVPPTDGFPAAMTIVQAMVSRAATLQRDGHVRIVLPVADHGDVRPGA